MANNIELFFIINVSYNLILHLYSDESLEFFLTGVIPCPIGHVGQGFELASP